MSVPYTGDVILISQKCCPSASSLEPRMAAVPQLYSEWKFTLRLSQLSNVAVDLLLASQTQSNSVTFSYRLAVRYEPRNKLVVTQLM